MDKVMIIKREKFSENKAYFRLGYDSELEPGVKFIIEGARGQYNAETFYIQQLQQRLRTLKNDFWFMTNLLEHYSSDKESAIKDCIERMKFRKPLFENVELD